MRSWHAGLSGQEGAGTAQPRFRPGVSGRSDAGVRIVAAGGPGQARAGQLCIRALAWQGSD